MRVLEPGGEGVVAGGDVHYGARTALAGSTPAYGPGLLLFNAVRVRSVDKLKRVLCTYYIVTYM